LNQENISHDVMVRMRQVIVTRVEGLY